MREPKHAAQTHQLFKSKKTWTTHTRYTIQMKVNASIIIILIEIRITITIIIFNWDYFKRRPQELRFKVFGILGADKIFKCLKNNLTKKCFFDNKTFFGANQILKSWQLHSNIRIQFFRVTIVLIIFTVNSTHNDEMIRVNPNMCHKPIKCRNAKKKKNVNDTHTQDAQLKGKWMFFMVTIITFFFEKEGT